MVGNVIPILLILLSPDTLLRVGDSGDDTRLETTIRLMVLFPVVVEVDTTDRPGV